jgi:group I intron endonuclease
LGKSAIYSAILKHGLDNFSLSILEYCEPSERLKRERDFFKLLKPEYNICLDPAAPFSGRKHSDKSKTKISDTQKDNTNGFKKGQARLEGAGRPSQTIEVTDITNNTTVSYN